MISQRKNTQVNEPCSHSLFVVPLLTTFDLRRLAHGSSIQNVLSTAIMLSTPISPLIIQPVFSNDQPNAGTFFKGGLPTPAIGRLKTPCQAGLESIQSQCHECDRSHTRGILRILNGERKRVTWPRAQQGSSLQAEFRSRIAVNSMEFGG
jgi:hypothetical protein